MSTVTFKGFGDFAKRAPRLMEKSAEMAGTELAEVTLEFLARKAIALTPVGPSEEAARRVAKGGSGAYGHMRNRWFKVVGGGGGQSGTKIPARSKAEIKAGQESKLVNDAAHARVIDQGRQESKPITLVANKKYTNAKRSRRDYSAETTFTRQIGSNRAKNGITKPLRSWGLSKRESMIKVAVRRAEAKVTR